MAIVIKTIHDAVVRGGQATALARRNAFDLTPPTGTPLVKRVRICEGREIIQFPSNWHQINRGTDKKVEFQPFFDVWGAPVE
jgi:hypothetical protein